MDPALTTPVVLIVFNRPKVTRLVFERIRALRPRTLLVIADGPRQDRQCEDDACRRVRQIVEDVTWPCEVLRNYSDTNLGSGGRVASGIDWVFQNVEEAIILEDDCFPDLTFFRFCEELLDLYRGEERVMHISGSNVLFGWRAVEESYYFSRYPLCWGWATWRRAWRLFDFDMKAWKADPEKCLVRLDAVKERAFWQSGWDDIARGRVNYWDRRWSLACLNVNGLAVTPSVNLVKNIGFGADAAHTTSRLAAVRPAVRAMRFPLLHPSKLERNIKADEFTARRVFYKRSSPGKAAEILRRRLFAAISHLRGRDYRPLEVPPVSTRSVPLK